MADRISICNLGLYRTGSSDTIEAFFPEEKTDASIACNTVWDLSVEETLRLMKPGWARAERALSLLDDEISGYQYVYAVPNDCLGYRYMDDEGGSYAQLIAQGQASTREPPFFIESLNSARNAKVLATNQENAVLVYTAKVNIVALFDTTFANALAWRIALNMAINKGQDTGRLQWLEQQFQLSFGQAGAASANERPKRKTIESSFTAARRV